MGSKGGHVILQRFEGKVELIEASDSDDQGSPKKKQAKCSEREVPMVVAICTPLMSRIQHSGETVFCHSTSTRDHFNTSLFYQPLMHVVA